MEEEMVLKESIILADMLGEKIGKLMNNVLKKANNLLKPHGLMVEITLNFRDLDTKKVQK